MATPCHRWIHVLTFRAVTDPAGTSTIAGLKSVFADPPRWLARAVRALTAVELAIAAAAMVLIFFLVLVQALQRYLPIDGWPWTGELARFCLVWLTFVVAGVLVSRDGHIAIESIDAVPSPRFRRLVRVLSCLIVAAVGVGLTAEAWELTQEQGILESPAMRMPMSWLYAISMIGFVSATLRALVAAVQYAVLGVPEPRPEDVEAPVA